MKKRERIFLGSAILLLTAVSLAQTEDLALLIDKMPWTGSGKLALELFKKAEQAGLTDSALWFKLGLALYDTQSYNPALGSFRHITQSSIACCQVFKFGAYVWQGHVLDLLGRREEALDCYRRALDLEKKNRGLALRHDQYGMVVDRAWVKARLSSPFSSKKQDPHSPTI
jgi:tetratricopeptide (TPR) repeat protein